MSRCPVYRSIPGDRRDDRARARRVTRQAREPSPQSAGRRAMPKRTFPIAAIVVAALALAACGGTVPASEPAAEPPPEPPATTESPPASCTRPTRAPSSSTSRPAAASSPSRSQSTPGPTFASTATARCSSSGPRPSPGFPTLETYRLSPDGIQTVLEEAETAGLLGPGPDYGMPPVTDLPTTTLTIALDDGSYSHSAYALGFDDTSGLTRRPAGRPRALRGVHELPRAARLRPPRAARGRARAVRAGGRARLRVGEPGDPRAGPARLAARRRHRELARGARVRRALRDDLAGPTSTR